MTENAHIARADASVYYNEIDPYCAAWLQNLMDAGHIAPGVIDTRSIEDVRPDEFAGYTQCHFFAGIGVWSLALRAAGWPESRPAWTGSCPCQPFSAAGKGAGFADERHLWPAWQHLIAQCRPSVVFGEQVASKAVDAWIDLVHADLEGMGYAFGCVPFPSAGVGAPHIRDRTFWVADAANQRFDGRRSSEASDGRDSPRIEPQRLRDAFGLGDANGARLEGHAGHGGAAGRQGSGGSAAEAGVSGGLADANGRNTSAEREQRSGEQRQQPQDGGAGGVANPMRAGSLPGALAGVHRGKEGARSRDGESQRLGADGWLAHAARGGRREEHADSGRSGFGDSAQGDAAGLVHGGSDRRPSPTNGPWRAADWLACTDGKWRPTQSTHECMADGIADSLGYVRTGDAWSLNPLTQGAKNRVGRLRAYGNAICAPAAQAFIESYCEARGLIALEAAA